MWFCSWFNIIRWYVKGTLETFTNILTILYKPTFVKVPVLHRQTVWQKLDNTTSRSWDLNKIAPDNTSSLSFKWCSVTIQLLYRVQFSIFDTDTLLAFVDVYYYVWQNIIKSTDVRWMSWQPCKCGLKQKIAYYYIIICKFVLEHEIRRLGRICRKTNFPCLRRHCLLQRLQDTLI